MSRDAPTTEPFPELIGTLTHELRRDVSAVLHQAELLTRDHLDDTTYRRSVVAIESIGESLMRFTENLADLGRVLNGDIRPVRRPIDVSDLITESVSDSERTVEWSTPANDGEVRWTVDTDPNIVARIVTGLLRQYDGPSAVNARAQRTVDQFVDIVFTQRSVAERAPFRPVDLDDGLALFLASKSAEVIGGGFETSWTGSSVAHLLRLPEPK